MYFTLPKASLFLTRKHSGIVEKGKKTPPMHINDTTDFGQTRQIHLTRVLLYVYRFANMQSGANKKKIVISKSKSNCRTDAEP